jgi:alpha 1,2-mannosyltransferase
MSAFLLLLLIYFISNSVLALENAAITYLIYPPHMDDLKESLFFLQKNFLSIYPYPVIFFYDKMDYRDQKGLEALQIYSKKLGIYALFQEADFEFPPNVKATDDIIVLDEATPVGYKKMIRFWFRNIFHDISLISFDYILRLDSDSVIRSKVTFDPFHHMHQKEYSYAYRAVTEDYVHVTVGLMDFVEEYALKHDTKALVNDLFIPPKEVRMNYRPLMFLNNFEILSLRRFRKPDFLLFSAKVDQTREIFWHRWGDAPLRYYSVMLFLEWQKEVWLYCNITYEHKHSGDILHSC